MPQTLQRPGRPTSPNLDADTERTVLDLARAGDRTAMSTIYRQLEPEARGFARRLVSASEVDDVVSDAFAKVFAAMANGRGPTERFAPYLMCAVRTAAWRLHRQRASEQEKARRLGPPEPAGAPDLTEPDEALVAAFHSLNERHRRVIWWFEVEGRSPAEVGAELGLTDNAAAALGYRARRSLRAAYDATRAAS